ncbi:hypothetical protein ACPA9J_31555 [Pseudomonas aeruginosa]
MPSALERRPGPALAAAVPEARRRRPPSTVSRPRPATAGAGDRLATTRQLHHRGLFRPRKRHECRCN